jgi:two-component system cell cycle response regulator DivK
MFRPVNARVLLVQPREDDRALYAELLRLHNLVPLEAATTDHAVLLAQSADVVVTGLRMPGTLDGLELVRDLRRRDPAGRRPLIVLTACALDADRSAAIAAGCDAFLTKPCLPDVLLSEIRWLLARTRLLRHVTARERAETVAKLSARLVAIASTYRTGKIA